jgi:hypothetical protein
MDKGNGLGELNLLHGSYRNSHNINGCSEVIFTIEMAFTSDRRRLVNSCLSLENFFSVCLYFRLEA